MSSEFLPPKPTMQHARMLRGTRLRVAAETARNEDQLTRESHAEHQIHRFQQGQTGAGVTLSRMASLAPTKDTVPIAGFLNERRDTQGPLPQEAPAKKTTRVTTVRLRPKNQSSLERWDNEGGANP